MSLLHYLASLFTNCTDPFPEEEERLPAVTFGSYTGVGDYTLRLGGGWGAPITVENLQAFLEGATVRPRRLAIGNVGIKEAFIKHHRVLEFQRKDGKVIMLLIERGTGASAD